MLRRKNSYTIIVPNSKILYQSISNWNYSRSFTAVQDIIFVVSYKDDPVAIREAIAKALDSNLKILKNPQPGIRLEGFESYGYKFKVRGFVSAGNVLLIWEIASQIRFGIVSEFQKRGISIATPISTVKLVKEDLEKENIYKEEKEEDVEE